MRSLAIIALLALAVAGVAGLAWQEPEAAGAPQAAPAAGGTTEIGTRSPAPPEAAPRAAPSEARGLSLVDLFTDDDVQAAQAGKRVYYQFSDESGNVHFVQSIDQVPPRFRARVGRVELAARDKPPARRRARASAAETPRRRPFAYQPEPVVVVYTAPWCGWCRKTLAHLEARRVAYVNKDIERDPAHRDELIRKTGRSSVPVVEIDGQLVRGHDPSRIDQLLRSPG